MVLITDVTSRAGSLLAAELLKNGEKVLGIDEERSRMAGLISDGMESATGDICDPVFLSSTLAQADTMFLIIPLRADRENYRRFFVDVADSVIKSARDSKLRNVIFLSSMGADEKEEAGLLSGYGDVEEILDTLDLENVTVARPGYFMDHLLPKISMIREKDMVGDVINGDTPLYFTDIKDVAVNLASMYKNNSFFGRSKVEMFSDKMTLRKAVRVIGESIDIPELPFVQMSDQDYRNHLIDDGASASFANLYVEMGHAISREAMKPSLIDTEIPNLPTRLSDYVQNVFTPAYRSGSEEI
ncbi:MAG: SDR family oxidoreductase [Chitinispirillaceae bacterium]